MSVSKPRFALMHCFQDAHWGHENLRLMQQQFAAPSSRVAASMLNSKLMKAILKPLAQHYSDSAATLPSCALELLWVDENLDFIWAPLTTQWVSRAQFCQQLKALLDVTNKFFVHNCRLAEAIFWSTAALMLVMPWQKKSEQTAPEQWSFLVQEAQAFLTLIDPRMCAFISWLPLEDEAVPRLQVLRKHCCLKYSTNKASFCKSCPTGRYKNCQKRL